jgi:hypothetical protein
MWGHRLRKWFLANRRNIESFVSWSVFPVAWCLVTWSFVGLDSKLWARSIGFMLFVYLVIEFAQAYYQAKAKERNRVD